MTIGGGILIVFGLTFSSYPWIGLLLIPLGIGGVVYFWYRSKQGHDKEITLKTIVGGIENLMPSDKKIVTDSVAETAKASGSGNDGVKPVVSKVVTGIKKEII